jgi:hypothetical protein
MKKFILFLSVFIFLFFGCATTNKAGNFTSSYDDVYDSTIIVHDDMKLGYFYNLKDSITGERENIRVYIVNNDLVVAADYQNKDWLHIDEIVFISDKGRLVINDGKQSGEVINANSVFIRENYIATLSNEQIKTLVNILDSSEFFVAFVGPKGRTDKLKISSKIKAAILDTVEKYNCQPAS